MCTDSHIAQIFLYTYIHECEHMYSVGRISRRRLQCSKIEIKKKNENRREKEITDIRLILVTRRYFFFFSFSLFLPHSISSSSLFHTHTHIHRFIEESTIHTFAFYHKILTFMKTLLPQNSWSRCTVYKKIKNKKNKSTLNNLIIK